MTKSQKWIPKSFVFNNQNLFGIIRTSTDDFFKRILYIAKILFICHLQETKITKSPLRMVPH